jgi:hypothetical protein
MEFHEDVGDVGTDGAEADHKAVSDLGVGQALCDMPEATPPLRVIGPV